MEGWKDGEAPAASLPEGVLNPDGRTERERG